MDCAPLNLAHFHERRADKLLKRHRYEDAIKAIETSLLYLEDAHKHVKIPKALEVLETQKWDYQRKLNQMHMRKFQYDKMKSKEIVPSAQIEMASNNAKKDTANAQSIARSIDKTIKDFNDKYGSTLLEAKQGEMSAVPGYSNKELETKINSHSKGKLFGHLETNIRRLSLIDEHLQTTDEDLPSLAPLELPSFDYTVFGV